MIEAIKDAEARGEWEAIESLLDDLTPEEWDALVERSCPSWGEVLDLSPLEIA